MKIKFSPMRLEEQLELYRDGDRLIVNGVVHDFSTLAEGEILLQEEVGCFWLSSDVRRVNGKIELTLILPHGARASAQALFPSPVDCANTGGVALPDG